MLCSDAEIRLQENKLIFAISNQLHHQYSKSRSEATVYVIWPNNLTASAALVSTDLLEETYLFWTCSTCFVQNMPMNTLPGDGIVV